MLINMAELIYKELSYKISGICFDIQNETGSSFNERQYQDILENVFKTENIEYEREKELFFEFRGVKIGGNKVDFVVENKLVIDLKAKSYITREDFIQMLRYLKAGNYKLGLIINFRGGKVTIKRVVNSSIRI